MGEIAWSLEILPGLPGTGPRPEQFSPEGQGHFREGLVVRFQSDSNSWIGNFQRGFGKTNFAEKLNDSFAAVIAYGQAYFVEIKSRKCVDAFGPDIIWAMIDRKRGNLIAASFTDIVAKNENGLIWSSKRLSWDGFRNFSNDGDIISGEAYTPIGEEWLPFTVDMAIGETTGGAYNEHSRR